MTRWSKPHSDGDWVEVVRQQRRRRRNGDIVAAMIDGEATVRDVLTAPAVRCD